VVEGKNDLLLQKEDLVTISSLFDLRDQQFVDVEGAVRNGGRFQYREGITLRDVILMAGGFQESADKKSIEISRRLAATDIVQESYKQSEIIRVDLSDGLDAKPAYEVLKPFDLLLIRQRGSFEVQRSVSVVGEVISPGRYALQNSRETISSLLKRTGGFKGSADSSAISIRRVANYGLSDEERQLIIERVLQTSRDSIMADPELRNMYLNNVDYFSINVEKIKSDIGGPEDLILENGDQIEVARKSNLIRVSGEVFRGGLLPYAEGTTAKYYIRRSGNYTTNARKIKTFVIYPDGRAISAKRFLLFKSYPKVTPRSEVFIPSKFKEGKRGLTTAEWIAISSIAATIATMVVTVVNATK
jgi:protein involved in polysaccharide export with SLBB domain